MAEIVEAGVSALSLPWLPLPPWQAALARRQLAARATWPHALLLHGPRGIGKEALALALAQGLLCESPPADGLACGQCPSCRYAVAGQHPDLLRLGLQVPDEDEESLKSVESIAVDRVRALIDFTHLTSHRQRAKVAVICPAERMNAAAANALLKTLEEPPPGTFLLLVADQPGRLPATVLSRCRKVAVPLPATAEAEGWLAEQGVADPSLALAQAAGAPLSALSFAGAAHAEDRRSWLSALANPHRLSVIARSAWIDAGGKEERKTRLAQAVEWTLGWTVDLARTVSGADARRNPDFAPALAALGLRVAPVALFRYHRTLLGHRARLAHPLQPRWVAEALLIDYKILFS